MATKSIPDGYHAVTPYLIIKGAADAIDFYKRVLGATELMRMPTRTAKSAMQRSGLAIPQSCSQTKILRWAIAAHNRQAGPA